MVWNGLDLGKGLCEDTKLGGGGEGQRKEERWVKEDKKSRQTS